MFVPLGQLRLADFAQWHFLHINVQSLHGLNRNTLNKRTWGERETDKEGETEYTEREIYIKKNHQTYKNTHLLEHVVVKEQLDELGSGGIQLHCTLLHRLTPSHSRHSLGLLLLHKHLLVCGCVGVWVCGYEYGFVIKKEQFASDAFLSSLKKFTHKLPNTHKHTQ